MALWRIRATVDDRPGYLSVLTASLALRSVNILAVQVHTTEAGAVDDFLVDAPDPLTEDDLVAAVERGRGRHPWVARAEAQALVDQPTRALALAGRLLRDPDHLGECLATLLGADEVTWRPTAANARAGFEGTRMRLPDPSGGGYEVVRPAPAFTPAEYARAQALVEVAAAALLDAAERVTMVLAGGTEALVRPAGVDDLAAVTELHRRCSPGSLRRRYLAAAPLPGAGRLRRLLAPPGGLTLLAEGGDARVVAMATLVVEGRLGQAGILVEDGWQRRGLGGALARRLLAYASRAGLEAVVACAHADNPALARFAPGAPVEVDGELATVTVPVAVAPVVLRTGTSAASG